MERLVIFNDYANLNAAWQQLEQPAEHAALLDYLSEGRFLVEAHAFVPVDPRNPHGRDRAIEELWSLGYLVHVKQGSVAGDSYRCDLDVEITLELMRTAEQVKPDIVVLISGDKDFIPVLLELRRRAIRVEVAALPAVNAARELMQKASGFIDLARWQAERDAQPMETDPSPGPDADTDDPADEDAEAPASAQLPSAAGYRGAQGRPGQASPPGLWPVDPTR